MAEVSFGEWLKRQRGAQGWTQQQLALQINCSISALRKLESEERRPSAQVIERLAELFNIPKNERKSFLAFARGDWQAISSPDGETGEAPWRVLHIAPRTNLPAALTSFIGREKEQTEVINLLTKHRLVALVGTGGVGKTRLSLKVGGQVLEEYGDGVWLVELAPLNDPRLVPQTIAFALGITTQSNIPHIELLVNFLRTKTLLLLLDNCEHLLDACAQLTDTLLKNCPDLKILAVSRESLGIIGEAIYQVPTLELPDFQQSLEKFRQSESARLFEERAQLIQLDFTLTVENASSVAQICHRVDGIPLAIELTAALVIVLSVEEIAGKLKENFKLLSQGSRVLSRHQTLQALMDWSHNLLSEPERVLFRRLSVFESGWTLEAAQAVCDDDAFSLTNALVKKSLIEVKQAEGRETRYRFHQVIRQYAYDKLIESGEEEGIHTRHLKYFLRLSEYVEPGLHGYQHEDIWFTRMVEERDNLRGALAHAAKSNVEAGLYISGRLKEVWGILGVHEGIRWLADFLQQPKSKLYPRARA